MENNNEQPKIEKVVYETFTLATLYSPLGRALVRMNPFSQDQNHEGKSVVTLYDRDRKNTVSFLANVTDIPIGPTLPISELKGRDTLWAECVSAYYKLT